MSGVQVRGLACSLARQTPCLNSLMKSLWSLQLFKLMTRLLITNIKRVRALEGPSHPLALAYAAQATRPIYQHQDG